MNDSMAYPHSLLCQHQDAVSRCSTLIIIAVGRRIVGPEDDGEYDEEHSQEPAADLVHVGRLLQILPKTAGCRLRRPLARLKHAPGTVSILCHDLVTLRFL